MDIPKAFLQRKRRAEFEEKKLKELQEEFPESDFDPEDVRSFQQKILLKMFVHLSIQKK